MRKKLLCLILAVLMALCIVPASAFAASQPSENAAPWEWEQFAEFVQNNKTPKEAAAIYKIAAEKYCEYALEEIFYFGPASSCYEKAIRLFEDEGMRDEVFECYEALGDAAFKLSKYTEAKAAYTKAKEVSETLDVDEGHLSALNEKFGDVFMALGEYNEAARLYSRAIDNADSSDEAYASLCLKYAKALEADGLADDPEGEMNIAKAFVDAAGILASRGKAEEAIAALKNGAKHYENAGEVESASKAYASVILTLAQAGKVDIAASLCFELYDTYGAKDYTAGLFTNIATPYYEGIKDYESAALAYEKAGDCYKEIDRKDMAKACYEEAAEYYEKAGNSSGAEAMKEKAKNSFALGSIVSGGNGVLVAILVFAVLILVAACIFFKRRQTASRK